MILIPLNLIKKTLLLLWVLLLIQQQKLKLQAKSNLPSLVLLEVDCLLLLHHLLQEEKEEDLLLSLLHKIKLLKKLELLL